MQNFYDEFAEHYDDWVHHDALNDEIITFYKTFLEKNHSHTIVYLGVATARIALKILNDDAKLIGIDNSKKMLEYAKKNLAQQKKPVTLYHENILALARLKKVFDLQENIFLLPFRTLGHFISLDSKTLCFENIYAVMKQGEYFLFDMELFDITRAKSINNQPIVGFYDEVKEKIIYNTFHYDFEQQSVKVDVHSANITHNTNDKKLRNLKKYTYDFSWINPEALEKIVEGSGFKVIHKHISNAHQMWIVQK